MSINERSENKNKGITFVSNTEEIQVYIKENLSDDIDLLSKKFNNCLKYLNRKWRTNVQDKRSNISPQIKGRSKDKPNDENGTQCYERQGFEHIK